MDPQRLLLDFLARPPRDADIVQEVRRIVDQVPIPMIPTVCDPDTGYSVPTYLALGRRQGLGKWKKGATRHPSQLRALVRAGADIGVVDARGRSALLFVLDQAMQRNGQWPQPEPVDLILALRRCPGTVLDMEPATGRGVLSVRGSGGSRAEFFEVVARAVESALMALDASERVAQVDRMERLGVVAEQQANWAGIRERVLGAGISRAGPAVRPVARL